MNNSPAEAVNHEWRSAPMELAGVQLAIDCAEVRLKHPDMEVEFHGVGERVGNRTVYIFTARVGLQP